MAKLSELGIAPIDLAVNNFIPSADHRHPGVTLEEAFENIDIGGPAIAAAAKNWRTSPPSSTRDYGTCFPT
jgi:phosphoribosylaminoimidazolecarboxamide formyltransferase/IMP cyclohydrolase